MPSVEKAAIQFVKWQPLYEKEKPFQIFLDLPPDAPDQRKTNLVFETVDVEVNDIRGKEDTFNLDTNGFAFRKFDGFHDLHSKDEVVSKYLPAVEELLRKEVEEVDRVFIFDWRMRESNAQDQNGFVDVGNSMNPLRPANFAHSDQGPGSVVKRVYTQLPDDAEELFKGRIRVLNIWKPLRNPVMDWPLAMCDGANLRASDLVETDSVRTTYIGTNLYSQYSPETQKWSYLRDQKPNEVVIFKQFDSDPDVTSPLSLHAAFRHETLPESYMPRKSIEVRALVFSKPKVDEGNVDDAARP